MIWVVIIAGIVWMLFRFGSDMNKQADEVKRQGGMRKKYAVLVNEILSNDPNCRLLQEAGTSITVGCSNISGSTVFDIVQTFGNVTIRFIVKNQVFGNHKLEWEFPETMDQHAMFNRISADVKELNLKVLNRFL